MVVGDIGAFDLFLLFCDVQNLALLRMLLYLPILFQCIEVFNILLQTSCVSILEICPGCSITVETLSNFEKNQDYLGRIRLFLMHNRKLLSQYSGLCHTLITKLMIRSALKPFVRYSGRSLMKAKKRTGSRTFPWDTPESTEVKSKEHSSSTSR